MNYQRSLVYSAPVPKMPPGLLEIMEGLSKDVLRNNPTNIYEFCADHMEKLLQIRDNNPPKKVLSLEQKIAKAQKIIHERAKQRCEKYDKMKIQQQIECVDETPMYMQRNVVIIPENIISSNQVELLDRGDIIEQNNDIITKSDDDEFVRALLINNSSINENDEEKIETLDNDMNLNLEAMKKENNDTENYKEYSIDILTMEDNIENGIQCETTMKNLNSDDDIKKIIHEEPNEEVAEKEILSVDVYNVASTPDTIEGSVLSINDNKISTPGNLKADKIVTSLDLESHSDPVKSDVDAETESRSIVTVEENFNGNEVKNKDSSDHSENISDRIPEDNISNNDGINTSAMDLETAAITIQKVFRSFLFKCKTTSIDESTNVDINLFINDKDVKDDVNTSNINKERRGISRMDTVLQTVNEEKSLSLSTDDSSTLSSAATVIQAHIRGFLVRNKLHINKTSSTSLHDSDAVSGTSLEMDSDQQRGKTILNIHIVPEQGQFISRDESLITSMDLSLDGSPRSLTNLHPHSYDINERRKQLKREDAVQSVSPPSNNSSSKQSEDIDSVKECLVRDTSGDVSKTINSEQALQAENAKYEASTEIQTAVESEASETSPQRSLEKLNTDEMDVVTPYNEQNLSNDSENKKIMHSSEFHEAVLPTQVSRADTSVVREFHNVLAYFLLWN